MEAKNKTLEKNEITSNNLESNTLDSDIKSLENSPEENINNSENISETTSKTESVETISEENAINEDSQKEEIESHLQLETSQKKSESSFENNSQEFKPYNPEKSKKGLDKLAILGIIIVIFSVIVILLTMFYFYSNSQKETIYSGIKIKGIDISDLTKEQAITKINEEIKKSLPEEIILKHTDYESTISTSNLNINFHIDEAVNQAYNIGRDGNLLEKNFNILKLTFSNINIEPYFSLDNEQLKKSLEEISSNLPDKMVQSGYYIENNNLIITKGKPGQNINIDEMLGIIQNAIYNLNFNEPIELKTSTTYPSEVNLEAIHKEIYKEPSNAYYTKNPYTVHPSENGLDFKISMEEAQNLLANSQDECKIPLKVIYSQITTNMIGSEAFPDLLSTFSTRYNPNEKDRTTNLKLAANKINGTVLMPGETFSYNKVVGNRTAAAGYKEAGTYVNGQIVDGIGGGICQITTTLYNAVLYANLDIVQRSNHQFIPSYSNASRDATVVYGAIDFKFKNNRAYPIKIYCSVSGGIAKCNIFGVKTPDDYEVQITSRITKQTPTAIYSEGYKTLKKNGKVVSTTLLSRDTYKRH